jgi:predicted MFS family arabinose efflux permease
VNWLHCNTAFQEAAPVSKRADSAVLKSGALAALFITGAGIFINVHAPQPVLPLFREVFHASELAVSLTIMSSVLGVALAAPFAGVIADRIERRRFIIVALFLLSVPTFLAATSTNLPQLIFWRLIQGIFVPAIIAASVAYIAEESPRETVGRTMSIYVAGTVVGGFAGRFLVGHIAPLAGWRASFVALGITTVALAVLAWRLLPASRHFVKTTRAGALAIWRSHLRNGDLMACCLIGFNVLFCLIAAFTYVNFYLTESPFHFSTAQLASLFSVYLIGAAMTPVSGWLLDRSGPRRMVTIAACLGATGILLTLVHSTPAVIAGLASVASATFISQAATSSRVGFATRGDRSAAVGLYTSAYYLGGVAGAVLPGIMWKMAGWTGCVALIVGFQIITVIFANALWAKDATSTAPMVSTEAIH